MASWGQQTAPAFPSRGLALGLVELEHQGALDEVRHKEEARASPNMALRSEKTCCSPYITPQFPAAVEASCIVAVLSASPKTAVQGEAQICKSQTCAWGLLVCGVRA